ncbi:MAG: aldehyde dehydrogenase family protein [Chitinophagales bacterium]|nr:aldehyde dehydrogenase family protein [Chitinophagales bacterium]
MNIINPATEELIAEIAQDAKDAIEQKFHQAKNAQPSWALKPLAERLKCIQVFYELLEQNKHALAKTLSDEVGKPLNQAINEINGARKRIKFFLDNSAHYLADEILYQEEGLIEKLSHEPLGVVANISAWNYPYLVGVNVFIPALLAGNAVMYKPSEYAALVGKNIHDLLLKSGIPAEVFQLIIGGREAGEQLLDLPLDGYFFTGSYRTGKYIYERVAQKMVPCQLELGGKDPMYITDDVADIAKAAEAAMEGAFYNNGQSCCAVERIYVHEHIYPAFVEAFVKETLALKLGLPSEEGTFLGPLTRKEQISVLEQQVSDALNKGGKLLTGGKRTGEKGYYFQPTVVTDANHDMLLMREESFGPVIGIQKVANDDEAVRLMKDTEYGLTAAVYTSNRDRAEAILKQMDTGSAYWNCCDRVSAHLPWSGRKHSGIGATLSYLGIRAFTKPKAYHLRG